MAAIMYLNDTEGTRRFLAFADGTPIQFYSGSVVWSWFDKNEEAFDLDVPIHKDPTRGRGWMEVLDPMVQNPPKETDRAYRLKSDELAPTHLLKGNEPPPPTFSQLLAGIFGVPEAQAEEGLEKLTGTKADEANEAMSQVAPHLFRKPDKKAQEK